MTDDFENDLNDFDDLDDADNIHDLGQKTLFLSIESSAKFTASLQLQ